MFRKRYLLVLKAEHRWTPGILSDRTPGPQDWCSGFKRPVQLPGLAVRFVVVVAACKVSFKPGGGGY
jgi:hypothetical protein